MRLTGDRRISVIQMGARRNYMAARQLERAGLLHSLVTDAAWPEGHLPWAVRAVASRVPRLRGPIARRTVPGIDPARVRGSLVPALITPAKRVLPLERFYTFVDQVYGWTSPSRLLDGADVVFDCFANGGGLLDRAKRVGKVIVTDFISHPRYRQIVADERQAHPGWEPVSIGSDRDWYEARIARLVALSDIYLCPSASVADALADVPGFRADRVRIVPYGPGGAGAPVAAPEPGRVLFAASAVTLAKGILYLAEAARWLRARGIATCFVVAGQVPAEWQNRPELDTLELIGSVDKARMAREFAAADVFCLPSLAEGSATVVYEALASGVPVVTTEASGSVVTDGRDGFIVPERNGAAIADAIGRIVADRPLRDTMAAAARETADRFSDDRCGADFLAVMREALAMFDARGGAAPTRSPHDGGNR